MKNVFFSLFFAAFIFAQLNCAADRADNNSNAANLSINTAAALPAANSSANTNAADIAVPNYTDADTALSEGNKFFDLNENEKAIDAYKQAVKLNPDLAEAYFKLGITYSLIENETDDASAEPTPTPKASKKNRKKDAPERITKSDKAFENAVKAYKKIIAKNPKDDTAHFNLGRSYNKLNEDQDAEKSFRQAVKLKPDDSEYQTELGAILIKLAQYDEAVRALKKAVELDDTNLQAAELLEKAEAGKKRIDYGVNKIVREKNKDN